MNQWTPLQAAIEYVMPMTVATGLFVSLFTAYEPNGGFGPTGAPDDVPVSDYMPVAGLTDIPCTAPPITAASIQATEVRALEEITGSEIHHVLLNAYYPALDAGWRGENANGTGGWICQVQWQGAWYSYNIMGVESDSQSQMTRVKIKLATV